MPDVVANIQAEVAGQRRWEPIQGWVLRIGACVLPLLMFPNTLDRYSLALLAAARLLAIALATILPLRIVFDGGFAT